MTTELPTTCGAAVRSSDWLDAIVCGDCLSEMPKIPAQSVDAIISDLPYGTTACKWDSVIPFASLWAEWKRLLKPGGAIVLTASQPFTSALVMSNLKDFRYALVWDKVNRITGALNSRKMPMRQHEDVLVFYRALPTYNPQMRQKERVKFGWKAGHGEHTQYGKNRERREVTDEQRTDPNHYPTSIISVKGCGGEIKGEHPTQKPVELMRYLVLTYTNPGDVVLDPCCGSGTTCVAAKQKGRHYIGIEKEQRYADSAKQRTHETLGMASNDQDQTRPATSLTNE